MSDAYQRVRELFRFPPPQPVEVRPSSIEEAGRWLKSVNRPEVGVLPLGQGRHSHRGAPPSGITHVLNFQALDKILDYSPADMTLQVEAGCPIAAIRRLLRDRRQCLPFLPSSDHGTIGGILAAGVEGPWAALGRPRDSLIGIQVLHPDGLLSHAGGQVVKNVAGYDLCKLYVGSQGTLGLLTRLTFKVRSAPRRHRTLLFRPGTIDQALDLARRIRDALAPTALTIQLPQKDPLRLRVGLLDDPSASRWKIERAGREADPERILQDDESRRCWETSERSFEGPDLVVEIFSRLGRLRDWQSRIEESFGRGDSEICFLRGRTLLRLSAEQLKRPDLHGVWNAFRSPTTDDDSMVRIRSAPAGVLNDQRHGLQSPPLASLQRQLRRTFDPNGILNPGRMA